MEYVTRKRKLPFRVLGLCMENGKENGNYCLGIGVEGHRVWELGLGLSF